MGKNHYAMFDFPGDNFSVKYGDTIIAQSSRVIIMKEFINGKKGAPVIYFPHDDVNQNFVTSSNLNTTCPLKGVASYYSISVDDVTLENAAWFYADPSEDVLVIKNYVAFYPDKFSISKG